MSFHDFENNVSKHKGDPQKCNTKSFLKIRAILGKIVYGKTEFIPSLFFFAKRRRHLYGNESNTRDKHLSMSFTIF